MSQDILQKIETASSPDFGNLLSKSFDLFKKLWVESFLHVLVTFLAVIPVMLVIYIPFIPVFINASKYNDYNNLDPSFDLSVFAMIGLFIGYILVFVLMQMITIAINAHFFKICKIKDLDSNEEDGGYFVYLKGGNFKKVLMLSLATLGISIAAMLLCIIPLFYVMVPLQLLVLIFAFNPNLSVSELISLSFKLGNKFWLLVFALIFVASLIAQLGVILCFVGVFFTAYFTYIPLYYFYKETIGFTEDAERNIDSFSTQYDN